MIRKSIRPTHIFIALIVVLGILIAAQAQANNAKVQNALNFLGSEPQTISAGPEADPYLRHAPGGYDHELEPPPIDMP